MKTWDLPNSLRKSTARTTHQPKKRAERCCGTGAVWDYYLIGSFGWVGELLSLLNHLKTKVLPPFLPRIQQPALPKGWPAATHNGLWMSDMPSMKNSWTTNAFTGTICWRLQSTYYGSYLLFSTNTSFREQAGITMDLGADATLVCYPILYDQVQSLIPV